MAERNAERSGLSHLEGGKNEAQRSLHGFLRNCVQSGHPAGIQQGCQHLDGRVFIRSSPTACSNRQAMHLPWLALGMAVENRRHLVHGPAMNVPLCIRPIR